MFRFALAGLFVFGCASSPPPAEAPPPKAAPAKTEAAPAKKKKGTSARELAAAMKDDIECTRAIQNLARRTEKGAFYLLIACVEQDKFRSLKLLLESPYRDFLAALDAHRQRRLLVHLLAIRGGDFSSDVPRLAAAGFKVDMLSEQVGKKDALGKVVTFRGKVRSRKLQKDGRTQYRVAELRRATYDRRKDVVEVTEYYDEIDANGEGVGPMRGAEVTGFKKDVKVGSFDGAVETGWVIQTVDPKIEQTLNEGDEFIWIGVMGPMNRDKKIVSMQIVDVFRRGVRLFGQ